MDPATIGTMVAGGARVAKQTAATVSELQAVIDDARDRGINSLSAYTKRTLLSSRVYIEDVIANEAVVPGLLRLINTLYASMCMVALRLNDIVTGGRSVRNILGVISTEEFHTAVDLIKDQFGDKNVSVKDVTGSLEDNNQPSDAGADKAKKEAEKKNRNRPTDVRTSSGVSTDAAQLFTGRLMEVTLGSGETTAKLYFIVQLVPYIIPSPTMEEYLKLNSNPTKSLRWAQYKAGEISFWKDFVFECDRVEKRRKALMLDKDGVLREMEDRRTHDLWRSIKNWFTNKQTGVVNRNVANSIIICSKTRIDKATRDLGLNIKNFNDRQKIMTGTLSLLIAVYDPNYGTVDLYLNGIRNRAEYTDVMVQAFLKKDNGGQIDLKQILPLIAAGNAQVRF